MEQAGKSPRRGRRWGAALARIVRERVLSRLDRRRIVFRWERSAVQLLAQEGPVTQIGAMEDLPVSIVRESDPAGMPAAWYRHFFAQGAVLWTALEDGRALGSLWVLPAARVGAWYLPLEPQARVIYGVVTPGWARGRGIAARLALAAARDARGDPVYLDCMAWNRGAQRAFAKAGFVPVAVVGSRWCEVRAGPDA